MTYVLLSRGYKPGGVNIDGDYTYGSDYQGDDSPSDINAANKSFAPTYHEIGRTRDNDGGNNNGGNQGASPGSQGPGGSDEMGSF